MHSIRLFRVNLWLALLVCLIAPSTFAQKPKLSITQIRDLVHRELGSKVIVDDMSGREYLNGDFNGDGFADLAIMSSSTMQGTSFNNMEFGMSMPTPGEKQMAGRVYRRSGAIVRQQSFCTGQRRNGIRVRYRRSS